jgi:hypothetical protein
MLLFRTVTIADNVLVVHSPMWIGLACVGVGIVVTLVALTLKWPRPWRLGAFLGTLILLYGGWHLLRNVITFESRGFYVESPLGEEMRVGWLQVGGIDEGGLRGAKNSEPNQLVFQIRSGGEASVDLSGLSPDEQARVVAFARKRLKP